MTQLSTTYLKGESHPTSHFTIHLSLLENLIVLVGAGLPDVDYTPREAVLECLDRLEVDIEGYRVSEWCLCLFNDNVEDVYQ